MEYFGQTYSATTSNQYIMNLKFTSTKNFREQLNTNLVFAGMICLVTVFSSCSKQTGTTITQTPSSIFAVVNASPNCPTSDFYLNSQMVNAIPFTYGNYLGYVNGPVGSAIKFGFYDTGTLTAIATDTVTLLQNHAYTVFFTNVISSPTFITLRDTIDAPANNSASIRLVNVSPDAPNVDLAIGNTVYATNIPYKQASKFINVPPAGNDTLNIRQTGTSTVLAKVSAVTIQLGGVYTIWLEGFANPPAAGEGLMSGLMENATFNN